MANPVTDHDIAEAVGPGFGATMRLIKAGVRGPDFQALIDDEKRRLRAAAYLRADCPILPAGIVSSVDEGGFVLLVTVPLVVPKKYNHERQLDSFRKTAIQTLFIHRNITDQNFARVTQRLEPGKSYWIKIFGIPHWANSDDCLRLYEAHHGLLTGVQGLSLAYQEIRGSLPVGKRILSFDRKEALWKDANGHHPVPWAYRYDFDDHFQFDLECSPLELPWDPTIHCVLVFCER